MTGGERGRHEVFENQEWKTAAGWGLPSALKGCIEGMSVRLLPGLIHKKSANMHLAEQRYC